MSISRRGFVRSVSVGGVGLLSTEFVMARGREAKGGLDTGLIDGALQAPPPKPGAIRINANENAYGPGASTLDAARAVIGPTPGRYPGNVSELTAAIAKRVGVAPENVLLGTGSGEIIGAAVVAFTSPQRALVTALPTWESPAATAQRMNTPVKSIRVEQKLRLDAPAMTAASTGTGLVFFCNPNNPTGTIHSHAVVTKFVEDVLAASPETTILIDEAYHDFVIDPSYATSIPLALKHPRVFVTRTFSKIHGMAGLRVGYAVGHPDTLKAIAARKTGSMNVLSAAAAIASIQDTAHIAKQRDLNRQALEMTAKTFTDLGYAVSDSQGNFLLVDVRRPTKVFRDACERENVLIGRDFPPLATHARISIGTLDEMRVANAVFKRALTASGATSSPA